MARAARALRRLHGHVLARERQIGRLRGGLRVLRAVALRRGRDADARDDVGRADPRAREGRRGRGRAPVLHGHAGPGALEARLRGDPRGRPAGRQRDEPQALRVDRPHERHARQAAQGRRHPARAPQRRDRALLLPGGLVDRPVRGPPADDRRGARGGAGDLRRRHPEPRRVARAARRDGLRAGRDQPDVGADQHAQPAPGDEVRRPRLHGPVGGGEVDRDLPADPPRGAVPPLRRPHGEPRRPPAAGRAGGDQRRHARQLPDDAGQPPRGGPRDVRGARAQRRAAARQRRQPAPRQPLGLARGRDARRGRRARRRRRAGAST